MPKKDQDGDRELLELARADLLDQKPGALARMMYFCFALLVVLIPSYMFHAIEDYNAEENPIVYGVAIVAGSLLLTYAYHCTMLKQRKALIAATEAAVRRSAAGAAAAAEAKADRQRRATNKARWFAFFATNAAYLASSYIASTQTVFGRFGLAPCYVLSTVVPAAGLAYYSASRL